MMIDPISLTAELVKCPSVTPKEGGALTHLQSLFESAGFEVFRVDRNGTPNLYARWGAKGAKKTLGFNGHTDVVPVGDLAAWTKDPFGAEIEDGWLYGRGATDMKSGVAAFAAAAVDFVQSQQPDGAIVLAITGDEEGPAKDGTVALLDWMQANDERMDMCIVGEPTCPEIMGDMMKIGRRGSCTAHFTVRGTQGHAAYPHRANNPIPALVALLSDLSAHELDHGTEHFDPSTLAITTIDTGNAATNVIPAQTKATVNIRFNDAHSGASLEKWLRQMARDCAKAHQLQIDVDVSVSGESFFTPPGPLSELISDAVQAITGVTPALSTSGGTSDARFMQAHCPVVEFGLVGHRMHGVDERVRTEQIVQLKEIYKQIMSSYFAA